MEAQLKEIYDAILEGERSAARAGVEQALAANIDPLVILDAMITSMAEVGRLFEEGEYFVPEMLISARSMQEGMTILKPRLIDADVKPAGVVVAGTVKGDLHDIGKNLVCMMLESAGFQVIDLGSDVTPEKFVAAVQEKSPDIIAMSALLTTTMPNMRLVVDALKTAGLRDKVKVMIGGAPVTDAYAQEIGADGYSQDASRAVKLAKSLVA
ncbi:MAG TPA: corrinoid protein [Bellilinea sp.]|jgi:5-methyltetrahydrofolate--homocysteine methyltransferase|nr:corrinoid protein [Bellilinea sp.]